MSNIMDYISLVKKNIYKDYEGMYREKGGPLKYDFITPGSEAYADVLWDWDSWLTNIAIRQILADQGDEERVQKALKYERGCVLNFLSVCGKDGWMPICIERVPDIIKHKPENPYKENMHKPCLAQHAAFLVRLEDGNAEWLREKFYYLQAFVNNYTNHHKNKCGLYFWQTDFAIGVDNDPCTYFRPAGSSGSIYLNCMMYKELEALVYLCNCLGLDEVGVQYKKDADDLKAAILEHCWDERDGFFYNVDLNLLPKEDVHGLHAGMPRDWDCLIQRIGVWSGFMALWAGLATPTQAKRVVEEHYRNEKTFNALFGVRTLSKMEKMYNVKASGNPSSWLGPIWGISNYMTFRGLVNYGFVDDARELAEKTIILFGRDFERFGALHEYYQPDNGEPILNRGFQNWNYLVLNMIAWYEGRKAVTEF